MHSTLSFGAMAATILSMTSAASAHMIMANPVPYSVDKLDNSPLTASDFPCKIKNGFTVSKENNMAVGDKQTLSFKGSAVHGGGSCQLAVTLDRQPTVNSKFKVIQSYEGGCPGVSGPLEFSYTIPKEIPNGQATFAWTWISKLSGQPEYYMNCAPITVTGGASDQSGFNSLPDLFVANSMAGSTCKSVASTDVKYPNPGQNLLVASGSNPTPPTGDCGAAAPGGGAASSAAGGAASSAVASSAPASSVVASSAASSATAVPSNTGGNFAPVSSAAASSAAVSSALAAQPTTLATSSVAVSSAVAAPSAAPLGGGAPQAGTCSTDGAVMCNGDSQFGLCDHGKVVWQAVAAGTKCENGAITKRNVHVHRRGRLSRPRRAH